MPYVSYNHEDYIAIKVNSPGQLFVGFTDCLRKHTFTHTRPFRCGLPGCTLKGGLCTANDLARHIKSRHPSYAPSDIVRRYRCHFPGCKSKDKTWPRLDNFRSHLKRVHSYHLTEIGVENVVHGYVPCLDHRGPADDLKRAIRRCCDGERRARYPEPASSTGGNRIQESRSAISSCSCGLRGAESFA
jgi:hypothetical protein